MKSAAIVFAVIVIVLLAIWIIVPQDVTNTIAGTATSTPSEPRSFAPTSSANRKSAASNSSVNASGGDATSLTPAQRFATATNYKKLYDDLAVLPDETGEARYFMGKAIAACNLFTGYKLEDHERVIPRTLPTKLEAFREMGRQCDGFYGFKGLGAADLWKQAAAKGYPGAIAASLSQLPSSQAETTAARLLESGDPEALEGLLSYLQPRTRFSTLEVDGQRMTPDVAANAWRLYACSRGADCGPVLFERCWAASECGAPTFETYLRDYKPQTYSLVRKFEMEIARAVQSRDWRTLGVVTSESR
jgi:hypothetical protein